MDVRYPIGKFSWGGKQTVKERNHCIDEIAATPGRMRKAVAGLNTSQLDTPYRDGGWTVRQVVHHVPDSHMNSYVRFKLALTEHEPTIRPYMENLWAELPEAKSAPIESSLALLDSLHKRWMLALRGIKPEEWKRNLRHPEMGLMSLEKALALYAWHGRHHVAHVTSLRERMSW